MTLAEWGLPSREELLSEGLGPGRRATTLLFAIEARTAQLVARAQQATALYLTQQATEERDRAFLDALASGRDLPLEPTIQDLERYAPYWASLVSDVRADLRAALAHHLGRKYVFDRQAVPDVRAALGLDTEEVAREYQRLYGRPLSSIYAPQIAWHRRVRWMLSGLARWLEALPPFWIALVLTLPIGPGLLALPIAVADVGPMPGIALLIFFGLINALTAAALAEAVARSGTIRFGLGYLGQMVSEYLGNAGSVLLTAIMAVNNFLVLIVFYLGISGTLEGATGLPAELWIVALFGIGVFFLSRKSLNSTVASALVITAINVILLMALPLFALPFVRAENLAYVHLPFVNGQPFDPSILTLILGVMLTNFFSHLLVANYGRVAIRRDPSARSWIWGCMAAIGLTTLLSCLWVVAFNGALSPQALASETGTALTALAVQAGPAVIWLGSILVVLSLGVACIHVSLALLFMVEERLPASASSRLGVRGRFLLTIAPVAGVFVVAEWLSITGQGSFAGLLALVGVIALPLLGGIFPVLLLAATRRKGDYVPGLVLKLLGSPIVLVGIYGIFLGSIFVYGLFIYDGLLERAITLLIGSAVLVVTLIMLRRGALDTRLVVELRQDLTPRGRPAFSIVAGGRPATAEVRLGYRDAERHIQAATGEIPAFASLQYADLKLPAVGARELKVWAHRITPEENSESLPVLLELRGDAEHKEFDLRSRGGWIVVPLSKAVTGAKITLREQEGQEATAVSDREVKE